MPDYALGPHTASLGLAYAARRAAAGASRNGMFVGQHGSWNRKPRSGYKVIFVPFADGKPAGAPVDVLTGLRVDAGGERAGRPVGVAIDRARRAAGRRRRRQRGLAGDGTGGERGGVRAEACGTCVSVAAIRRVWGR